MQEDGRLLDWGGVTCAPCFLLANTFMVPLSLKVLEGDAILGGSGQQASPAHPIPPAWGAAARTSVGSPSY